MPCLDGGKGKRLTDWQMRGVRNRLHSWPTKDECLSAEHANLAMLVYDRSGKEEETREGASERRARGTHNNRLPSPVTRPLWEVRLTAVSMTTTSVYTVARARSRLSPAANLYQATELVILTLIHSYRFFGKYRPEYLECHLYMAWVIIPSLSTLLSTSNLRCLMRA